MLATAFSSSLQRHSRRWRIHYADAVPRPRSRSSRIIWLLEELGAPFQLRHVTIRYMDGSGDGPDPANPHPDKKVPALLDNDALVTESAAVATYLADLLPMAGLAPASATKIGVHISLG
ncbi:glutathione S-transferase [Sphingomonas sp. WKB10]|nr:glutathione S-transferase [Sphingomonas sp. WKB10]